MILARRSASRCLNHKWISSINWRLPNAHHDAERRVPLTTSLTMSHPTPFSPNTFSRRQALQWLSLGALSVSSPGLILPSRVTAQEAASKGPPILNRFPRMVQEYFVDQLKKSERQTLTLQAALKTK